MTGDRDPLRRALIALCVTEITSWGTLYYALPAMVVPLSRDSGWSATLVMTAFSGGLLVSAVAGIGVGRLLDRFGPRPVMTVGSVLGSGALLAVAAAPSLPWFFAAWALAGLAQAALLYPPAFAALTRWYGPRRVRALTILSLVAGLASTIFAPLTAALVDRLGWRTTVMALAALLAVITLPLHAAWLTPAWPTDIDSHREGPDRPRHLRTVLRSRAFALLVVAMMLSAFGLYAATVDIATLLVGEGMANSTAALALALIGLGQVCGRLGYGFLNRYTTPSVRTAAVLAAGAAAVALLGLAAPIPATALAAAAFAGATRGIYTLLQATAIADRWGTTQFATLNGIFVAPLTAASALAPAGGTLLMHALVTPRSAYYLLAAVIAVAALIALPARRLDITQLDDASSVEPLA